MFLYFIQQGDEKGPIKIGSSADPKAVLTNAREFSPDRLTLIAAVGGDEAQEKRLHRAFAKHRVRDDWYQPVQEMIDQIAELKENDTGPERRRSKMAAFTLPPDVHEKIDRLAKRFSMGKSSVVRELVRQAPEEKPFVVPEDEPRRKAKAG